MLIGPAKYLVRSNVGTTPGANLVMLSLLTGTTLHKDDGSLLLTKYLISFCIVTKSETVYPMMGCTEAAFHAVLR